LKYSKLLSLNGDSPNQNDTQTGEISGVMVNSSSILLTSTNKIISNTDNIIK